MQVQLDLAGVGLSFTRPTQEVFYASMSGIRARATTSNVRHTLELEIRSIQAPTTPPVARVSHSCDILAR